MAFLGGLLSTLGPMLPGIISTVGDIVKRVANRPEGQSFGSALLGAAPAALSGISGVAKGLAPALGGAAGGVLSKIGEGAELANQFIKPSDEKTPESSEKASPHAVDMLPVRHGAPNSVPPMHIPPPMTDKMQNRSGPLEPSGGEPPAELYNKEAGVPSMHPGAQRNHHGARTVIDRVATNQSHGSMPSFNIFDKLSRRPPLKGEKIELIEEPTHNTLVEELAQLRRKNEKRKVKKMIKRGKKGGK